jgi:hypothetical protein
MLEERVQKLAHTDTDIQHCANMRLTEPELAAASVLKYQI